jgi:hypothetical protein
MELTGHNGQLKSEFVLDAGADPGKIRIRYENATAVHIAPNGALRIDVPEGAWEEAPLWIYQPGPAGSHDIAGRYHVAPDGLVTLSIDSYDSNRKLVIDPIVTFSSLVGNSGISCATAAAVDSAGYVYVAGYTDAFDLPAKSSVQPRSSSVEAYIAKINPSTGQLVYATYIGGSADDRAFALAVSPDGSVFIAGWTTSSNFPRVLAAQSTLRGSRDAFLLRLAPNGSALTFSTYFGGEASDQGNAIALAAGEVWLAGDTHSPVLSGSGGWRSVNQGGRDGFVSRFSSAGQPLTYTFVGGTADDSAKALAVDPTGNVFVGGSTESPILPLPFGAAQTSLNGGQDAFLLKFDAALLQLIAGTYLGGSLGGWAGPESVYGIALDALQNVYAVGATPSPDFPSPAAWVGTLSGLQDAFILKLSSGLNVIQWGTYVGGAGKDLATSVGLDARGGVIVGGSTTSTNFPSLSALQAGNRGGSDGFIIRLSQAQGYPDFSTCYGGTAADGINAVAMTPSGSLFVAGQTGSADIALKNPVQQVSGSALRMLLGRIALGEVPALQQGGLGPSAADGQLLTLSATHSLGANSIASVELLMADSIDAQVSCRVRFNSSAGLLSLADDLGVNWSAVRIGTSDSASNSSCSLLGSRSSFSALGTTLSLSVLLQFRPAFAGFKKLYTNLSSISGEDTGLQLLGSIAVQATGNQTPSVGGAVPNSGGGASASLSFTFLDANGADDIWWTQIIINDRIGHVGACTIHLDRISRLLYLVDDAGVSFLPGVDPGTSASVENGQCQLRMSGTTTSVSGTVLTLTLDVAFKSSFQGDKVVYANVADRAGAGAYWIPTGTWKVTSPLPNGPPSNLALSPSGGGGSAAVFAATFYDPNGGADIQFARLLFNSNDTQIGGCAIHLDRINRIVYLVNDMGTSVSIAHLGTLEIVENSQCQVRMEGTTHIASGTALTVQFNVVFKAPFAGTRPVYTAVSDTSEDGTWWVSAGTYTVSSSGTNVAPSVASLVPTPALGSRTLLSLNLNDPNGALDIAAARLLINSSPQVADGCYLMLNRAANLIYLSDNLGANFAPIRIGSSESAQNGQCTIFGAGSSLALSGTQVLLKLDVAFNSAFAGAKNMWSNVSDASGLTSPPSTPAAFSVTP